jgi:hypothetical protein
MPPDREREPVMPRRVLVVGLLIGVSAGCASLREPPRWGERATLSPGWGRVGDAAVNALLDPHTWVPAVGAAVFAVGDWDERVTHWATHENPIFGSPNRAKDWSNGLAAATYLAYGATSIASPGGDTVGEWASSKGRGLLVGLGALGATGAVTIALKVGTGRTRPDGSSDRSFPSGHASQASAAATLASRNLDWVDVGPGTRQALSAGFYGLAGLTGWARVEGRKHYTSDVLAGYAIGHFLAAFLNDALIGPAPAIEADVSRGGVALAVTLSF